MVFAAIATLTLAAAVAAMSLRSLVHCALLGAVVFAGLAAMFLQLGAQFVGFAQLLVYVGAVAILIVFAILLTRGGAPSPDAIVSPSWRSGLVVAVLVGVTLIGAVWLTPSIRVRPEAKLDVSGDATVKNIGMHLMTRSVLPLEIAALLLTSATIGAVLIAMHEKGGKR